MWFKIALVSVRGGWYRLYGAYFHIGTICHKMGVFSYWYNISSVKFWFWVEYNVVKGILYTKHTRTSLMYDVLSLILNQINFLAERKYYVLVIRTKPSSYAIIISK